MSRTNLSVKLHKQQMKFVTSDKARTLYSGGVGSGKTFSGAMWAAMMCLKYPDCTGIITAGSFKQLRNATLPEFFKVLDMFKVSYKHKINDATIIINGKTKVILFSAENYEDIVGVNAGWAWADECAFYNEMAYHKTCSRLRDVNGPCQWKGTTTTNGFNWLYRTFVDSPIKSSVYFKASTKDNLANLGGDYYETLKEQFDDKLVQQELEGEFVNLTSGNVYYSFDRRKSVIEYTGIRNYLFIGLDFNVDPLCGVFCCVDDKGRIFVVDEMYLRDSNTFAASKEILKKYPHQYKEVVPDETGNRRKTSSSKTDHQILRDAHIPLVPFKNPSVKDRYNNINRLIDKELLFVSPKCKYLIRDLESLIYDNKDKLLSHITDALGYVCWHLSPMKKPRRVGTVRSR